MRREKPVQLIRECVAVGLAPGRGSAGLDAAPAQLVHEVAHGQALLDIVLRIEHTPRIERVAAAADHLGRERNVGSHDEVSGLHLLHDLVSRVRLAVGDGSESGEEIG